MEISVEGRNKFTKVKDQLRGWKFIKPTHCESETKQNYVYTDPYEFWMHRIIELKERHVCFGVKAKQNRTVLNV